MMIMKIYPMYQHFREVCQRNTLNKVTFLDALCGAAVVFANALKGGTDSTSVSTDKVPTLSTSSMSPTKAIEIRMKFFKQLR